MLSPRRLMILVARSERAKRLFKSTRDADSPRAKVTIRAAGKKLFSVLSDIFRKIANGEGVDNRLENALVQRKIKNDEF